MDSSSCAGGDHSFDAARCGCGELAITEIESNRDTHWPLWPYYIGQRTSLTDTALLTGAFRSIVRIALGSGPPTASDRRPLRAVR